jgi:ketosteroid isomerase-like protein
MTRKVITVAALFFASALGHRAFADAASTDNQPTKRSTKMNSPAAAPLASASHGKIAGKATDVVKEFFAAFGKGDVDGVIASFSPNASIVAVRNADKKENHYGTYKGKEGVKDFLATLGKSFDTKAFAVNNIVGEGNVAFANGSFTHKLKSTGKLFSSDWALMTVVKEGKILEYHFYEDSQAFAFANN